MNSRIWYRALLSTEQIGTGQIDVIRGRFEKAMAEAGAPAGACLFVTSHDTRADRLREDTEDSTDVNADAVYFSPLSVAAVPHLISEYGAEPSEPPERTGAALLVGEPSDWDLLPRSSH